MREKRWFMLPLHDGGVSGLFRESEEPVNAGRCFQPDT
jgi:hypothetical protein